MIVQTVTIPAGAHGIDFAYWRPGDEIADDAFVVRYVCKPTTPRNPKAATRAEIDFYHSLRVAVLLVFEQGAADWQQGAAKGAQQGHVAASEAALLGYPAGLAVLMAFDTNAAPGDARALAYGAAAHGELAPAYELGEYADLDAIRVLAAIGRLHWLAGATQWSDPTKPYQPETMPGYELVHVRQTISGSTPNYDNNVVLRPFQAWLPHDEPDVEAEPPAIPTTPTEDEPDMPKYYVADSATHGSALVATTFDAAGAPRYTMEGFTDGQTARAWRDAYGNKSYSDADYDALAASASR